MSDPSVWLIEHDPVVISSLVDGLRARSVDVLVGSLTELLSDGLKRIDIAVFGPSFATEAEMFRSLRAESDALACALGGQTVPPALVAGGLAAGLDDFIPYPIDFGELAERFKAMCRRKPRREMVLSGGGVTIRLLSQVVTRNSTPIDLSKTEFRLLLALMREKGRPRSRQDLLQEVWGYAYLGRSRLVDMAVRRLREKIEDDPHHPGLVLTAPGGYLFSGEASSPSGHQVASRTLR